MEGTKKEKRVDFETAYFFENGSSIKIKVETENVEADKLEKTQKEFEKFCELLNAPDSKKENGNAGNITVQMGACDIDEIANVIKKRIESQEELFAIIPDDQTRTMILCPIEEGQCAIKLTKKTAKLLIAMIDRQIQEWL